MGMTTVCLRGGRSGSSSGRLRRARTGDGNMSQMHFARKGLITEEMAFVAQKEKISAELGAQ